MRKIEENEAAYQYLRWKYEADMIKDPTTGKRLFGLRDQEIEFARTIRQGNNSSSPLQGFMHKIIISLLVQIIMVEEQED